LDRKFRESSNGLLVVRYGLTTALMPGDQKENCQVCRIHEPVKSYYAICTISAIGKSDVS